MLTEQTTKEIKALFAANTVGKWQVYSNVVNDNLLELKLFNSAKECFIQVYKINGISHSLTFNYETRSKTLKTLLEQLNNKI